MKTFKLLINGNLVDGQTTMPVMNPATEKVLAVCPRASLAQLNEAIRAAKSAFGSWSQTHISARRAAIGEIAIRLEAEVDELATLLVQEQGKCKNDAVKEIRGAAACFRYFSTAELPGRLLEDSTDRRVELHRKPLGVVAAIVPWNFPISLMATKVPPALLTGNSIIVKPSPTTPLTTLRIAELVRDVVPAGVISVIADANDLGDALTGHPDVRKISFTGSIATGKRIMSIAAPALKRITLELGGNDAGIVLEDADPEQMASRIFWSAFRNNGQLCVALKRLYVHERIYDSICDRLAALADQVVVGDGLDPATQLGPVQNRVQYAKVIELIHESRAHGKLIAGGAASLRPGYFVRPTIFRDIKEGARIVDEEQFGPVLPIIRYSDAEDVVRRANATHYGLGGSIWSSNPERAYLLASKLNCGVVWINKHGDGSPQFPFAGANESGFGVELGEEGLAEFTQIQVVNIQR